MKNRRKQTTLLCGLAVNRGRKGVFVLTNDTAIGYKTRKISRNGAVEYMLGKIYKNEKLGLFSAKCSVYFK